MTVTDLTRNTWRCMRRRCNGRPEDHPWHAGKGIKVCERWDVSFQAFLEDMGQRPSKDHTIDRIDGDGDYEPGNCRWATRVEQHRNRKIQRQEKGLEPPPRPPTSIVRLTKKQLETFHAIDTMTADRIPPTARELAKAQGVGSGVVGKRLDSMRKKGVVAWEQGKNRTLKTVKLSEAAAEFVGETRCPHCNLAIFGAEHLESHMHRHGEEVSG